MGTENFIYWLQGFVEMTDTDSITDKQWQIIKEHLALVTNKMIKLTVKGSPVYPSDPIRFC